MSEENELPNTPAPTPEPTQPPAGTNFIGKGTIIPTLLNDLQAEQPTLEASALRSLLAIRQVCDEQSQVDAEVNSRAAGTVGRVIYDLIRNNSNDVSRMPGGLRYNITNGEPVALLAPVSGVATEAIAFHDVVQAVPFRTSRLPATELKEGAISVKSTCRALVRLHLNLKATVPEDGDIEWRSNDPNSRMVVVSLALRVYHKERNALEYKTINLGDVVFFEEDVLSGRRIVFEESLSMSTMDGGFRFGYIDTIELMATRSAWVVSKDGTRDVVEMVTDNTTGNYLEIIEL